MESPASGSRRPYGTASDCTGQYEAGADEMAAPIEQQQAASKGLRDTARVQAQGLMNSKSRLERNIRCNHSKPVNLVVPN